jgi:hypothetical protein
MKIYQIRIGFGHFNLRTFLLCHRNFQRLVNESKRYLLLSKRKKAVFALSINEIKSNGKPKVRCNETRNNEYIHYTIYNSLLVATRLDSSTLIITKIIFIDDASFLTS